MIEEFQKIQKFIVNKKLIAQNPAANEVIQDYNFIHISEHILYEGKEEESKIYQNISNSKVIIIDQNQEFDQLANQKYYLIGFEKTIILLNESSLSFLQKLLLSNPNLPICFLTNKDDFFTKNIKNPEIEISAVFKKEIEILSQSFNLFKGTKKMKQIWPFIVPCITGYLIKKSYSQLNKNRVLNFIEKVEKPLEKNVIKAEDYVELRNIGIGSLFSCKLIYHIKHGKLYVIKRPHFFDEELPKLIKREKDNYLQFKHPFLPKFYGTVENEEGIVIEFINGRTLNHIKQMNLTTKDVFHIIYEICVVIEFFHRNDYIYRDLKANNIIIDENKTVVLIDLDRLIKYDPSCEHTLDLTNVSENPSFDDDIRYVGKTIKYILQETKHLFEIPKERDNYSKIEQISEKCININTENKLSMSDVIDELDAIFGSKEKLDDLSYINTIATEFQQNGNGKYHFLAIIYITGKNVSVDYDKAIHYLLLAAKQNYAKAQYLLGVIYETGKSVSIDINKAIHYYSLAADQSHAEAQFNLGVIYYTGKHISINADKAIHYFQLAADQNHAEAQFNLGVVYFTGYYVPIDINKAIHYYSLAADQNNEYAQFNLGYIYSSGYHVPVDINKAIHYYSLAANNNFALAQFNLGFIYDTGYLVSADIEKAIHYYSLAANQSHAVAQYNLGSIYLTGMHNEIDIDKTIYYFTLAANLNHLKAQYAQFNLGVIYNTGEYVSIDIDKAIYYYSLAAKQNHAGAQFNLGVIYGTGKLVPINIERAIYYYTLAANQNHADAQFNLGYIYDMGKNVPIDTNKAIHYYSLAAKQNHADAQFNLGYIYDTGKNVPVDTVKAIHYYSLAANQNLSAAQYILGIFYYLKNYSISNMKKSVFYIVLASKNGNREANFGHGFLLHEGKYIKRDIPAAVHYLKEASSFNNQFAKNNLGILYKHGFGEDVPQRISQSIEYFEEAIRQKKDYLSMYNLSLIYFYDRNVQSNFDSLDLLIKSSKMFNESLMLLCLVLVQKYDSDLVKIMTNLEKRIDVSSDLLLKIKNSIIKCNLLNPKSFDLFCKFYRERDYLYDILHRPILTSELGKKDREQNEPNHPFMKDISQEFYDGLDLEDS
ncbi:hypothetical protein M9Y10_006521 [Tritrichomonas musculus]|uniref:Protein kinase domain-containing protein n=1 Tax=Tritrichomonas musculus TaxID=1915356 RepID=A0ABR2JFY7_9EUKA